MELLKSEGKNPGPMNENMIDIPLILNQDSVPLDTLEALTAWIKQCVLERELEEINSLLCAPCNCVICCTGPESGSKKEYYNIPLKENELSLFDLPRHEILLDRLPEDNIAHSSSPALYHLEKGWSMILPRESRCPQLSRGGRCAIYENRPSVCRKPQIFPYVIQKNEPAQAYIKEERLLAVWDCPYVRKLKEEIIQYGQKCGLETVFMKNKV
jgi:Fe-S-cluster containining protein